ncbi:MAG: phosphoribosyl-ATP diphosphatase [Conexivisphaera sp.]
MSGAGEGDTFEKLYGIILDRLERRPEGSYTASLAERGMGHVARKVGEEAAELMVAALTGEGVAAEAADLIYHVLVLLAMTGVGLEGLKAELERRMPGVGDGGDGKRP